MSSGASTLTQALTEGQINARFIPFSSLQYSTEAFIDYCIPECAPKYNYALIGAGVSQSPKQPVSLREKHGFQLGGISMPHGKRNPPHMHFTAEVFICTRGQWEVHWGFNPGYQTAEIGEGDILTVPTWIYRGFKNVGVDDGFSLFGIEKMRRVTSLMKECVIALVRRTNLSVDNITGEVSCARNTLLAFKMHQLGPVTKAVRILPFPVDEIKLQCATLVGNA